MNPTLPRPSASIFGPSGFGLRRLVAPPQVPFNTGAARIYTVCCATARSPPPLLYILTHHRDERHYEQSHYLSLCSLRLFSAVPMAALISIRRRTTTKTDSANPKGNTGLVCHCSCCWQKFYVKSCQLRFAYKRNRIVDP